MKKVSLTLSLLGFAFLMAGCETTKKDSDQGQFFECRKHCQDQGMLMNIDVTTLTGECRCTTNAG